MSQSSNSKKIGDILEKQILDFFSAEIDSGRFWGTKSSTKIFQQKGYFSKDRNTDIFFDVSIVFYLPGATEYAFVFLIECKNYSHSVPVNDIEEFHSKTQQVASSNSKSILASTSSFQAGTRSFAESKGIGLLRYFRPDDVKWELMRSPSSSTHVSSSENELLIQEGLSENDFQSFIFDFYLQTPIRKTNSLWDFFNDLASTSELSSTELDEIRNQRGNSSTKIPFIEKYDLESLSDDLLSPIEYSGGEVNLDHLCQIEFEKSGLVVNTISDPISVDAVAGVLGKINFDPPIIHIYKQQVENRGRERFTLAHELAHYFLHHGNFLKREHCDDSDFNLVKKPYIDKTGVARLEFQANYLAASLLMPRRHFLADFKRLIEILGLHDRGFGQLFVDNQICNLESFEFVMNRLVEKYGVSRTAAKIRLDSMDLLKDVRTSNFTKISLGLVVKQ